MKPTFTGISAVYPRAPGRKIRRASARVPPTRAITALWQSHVPTTGLALALLLFRRMSTPDTTPTELQRDPDEWKTGDEPMTAAQRSYLETLSHDTGEAFEDNLTKAEASKRIDELRGRSPRVSGSGD